MTTIDGRQVIPAADLPQRPAGRGDALVGVVRPDQGLAAFPISALPTPDAAQAEIDALKTAQQTSAIYADTLPDLQAVLGTYVGQGGFVNNGQGRGQYIWNGSAWIFSREDVLSQKADKSAVPSISPITDDVMVITDAEGNRSWMEAAMGTGAPTQRVGDELRQVLRIEADIAEAVANRPDVVPIDGDVFRLTDPGGLPSWIEAQLGTGRPTNAVGYAIANVTHLYAGPDQPPVWPGNFVIWTQLDSSLVPVQTYLIKG